MRKRFVPVWGRERGNAPAAAPQATDAESGADDAGDRERSLRALEAMRERGLVDAETYARRRAAILGGPG